MQHYSRIVGLIATLSLLNAQAEITLDGSWGRNDILNGPQFDISAELGQQFGNNLFHSFKTFNLHQNETATFSGPDNISNVISRVTGGTISTIDGTFRSLMPQADMYFLNPAGIIIGEHATLDVQGAMHFSTADELLLGEDGKFAITHPQNTLLTIAPPSAFGFLTDTPAAMTLQGGQLSVSEGKTLSMIGGDINLQSNSLLEAIEGRLNIASVASPGKVIPTSIGLELDSFAQRGHLTAESATLDVSGQGAGSIYIRAGQFEVNNSEILGRTLGHKDGGITDIAITDLNMLNSDISNSTEGIGKGGDIIINAEGNIILSGSNYGLFANALPKSTGDAGKISVTAKNLNLSEEAKLNSSTWGTGESGLIHINISDTATLSHAFISTSSEETVAGNAGVISIQANQLTLTDNAEINSITYGTGQSGEIKIHVAGEMILSASDISANSELEDTDSGNAGIILIEANNLTIDGGGQITNATWGGGQGGSVTLNVVDTISLEGFIVDEENEEIYASGPISFTAGSGKAGSIELNAKHLIISDGAGIGSATYYNSGPGDKITINASESVHISGSRMVDALETKHASKITSASLEESTGNAGQIIINTHSLILSDSGEISTSAEIAEAGRIELNVRQLHVNGKAVITSESQGDGNAGSIHITASDNIHIENARVSTQAAEAAGGNIEIEVPNVLYVQDGNVTTSVKGGAGGGGDISIQAPMFVALNKGKIIAQAVGGDGGNIRIVSEQLITTPDSLIDASSQKGINGEIVITAPESDIGGKLLILSGDMLRADNRLQPPCVQQLDKQSSFLVKHFKGSRPSPYDFKPSLLLSYDLGKMKTASIDKKSRVQTKAFVNAARLAMDCR
jgi:filamentous hemagglutinin family protein